MQQALNGAVGSVMIDVPWFILCCVPLMPLRKIDKRTMAWRIVMLSILWFVSVFFGILVNPQGGTPWIGVIRTMLYVPMLGLSLIHI